jgi:hypothetical protein
MVKRRSRDLALIDALDALERHPFNGDVWRITREGRDPLLGSPVAARWDLGNVDVLYTSLEQDGALAEIGFHLLRQPVFPTKLASLIHRIRVKTTRTLKIGDARELEALGILPDEYKSLNYGRCQEIGDAAAFLGFDGLLVPSARWPCLNLVLYTDQLDPADTTVLSSEAVDWIAWKANRQARS